MSSICAWFFLNAALICSCNCIGVKPVALISPISGSVIIPSGRTGTTLDISGSFHTLMLRTSSTPMTKLSGCTSATRGGVVSEAAGCPDLAGSVESGNAGLATLAEFVEFCPDRRTQPTAQQNQQCQHKNCTISQVPFLRTHLPTFCQELLGLLVVFAFARGTGTPLGDPYFLEFVKQRAVADIKRARRLFPVPVVGVQCVKNNACFQLADRLPGQLLQRDRPVEHEVVYVIALVGLQQLTQDDIFGAHHHVTLDEILQLTDIARPGVTLHLCHQRRTYHQHPSVEFFVVVLE